MGSSRVAGDVEVRVYAELNDFVPTELRGVSVRRPFRAHQTVKDVEAFGIPLTEVDLVLVNGETVGFAHRPAVDDRLSVFPVFETIEIGPVNRLRPRPLRHPRLVVDVHVGRLARLLWLVGFDARWGHAVGHRPCVAGDVVERRVGGSFAGQPIGVRSSWARPAAPDRLDAGEVAVDFPRFGSPIAW
ncbi:MAG TPA: hypothetical protein VFI46_15060 [Jiangellaceae bacterium]|nr:hypothetical protein [Jiangellaceae bacterium]